ncbi:hypothetical protein N7523_005995 [Penicillium sp. IBT 18751x]|nr:hypothetical protein N7523_005995 [Penicillium sp. IBT 18751x]
MRSFITALLMAGAVTAQITSEYLDCATAALDGIDLTKFNDCTDMTSAECLCANKDALSELTQSAKDACSKAGISVDDLDASLCATSSNKVAAPARHASKPMQPAGDLQMRAYSPSEEVDATRPQVMTVTVTESCACKATPTSSMHVSQIPVYVPVSSSMGGMAAASSPVSSHGVVMVGASSTSAIYNSWMATPTPSGASANHFNTFQGAAPQVNAAHGGVAAVAVAAVMGLMIAL